MSRRRAGRNRRTVAGIILVVLLVASAGILLAAPARDGMGFGLPGDAIMLVQLSGPIQESVALGFTGAGAGITPGLVRNRLETAERNPRVRAVVVRLDTPGGTVAASQEIAALVRDFPLPVVVSMGDVAASGGYYFAAAADRIVAQPGTTTGSIGVAYIVADFDELLDKIGVRIDLVTAGEHKEMVVLGRIDDTRRALLQTQADLQHEDFIAAVADGRDLPVDTVRRLATGETFLGQQALEHGLVDVLGGLDDAIAEAEQLAGIDDAEIIAVRPGFWESLMGGPAFGWSVQRLLPLRPASLLGLPDEWRLFREALNHTTLPRFEVSPP